MKKIFPLRHIVHIHWLQPSFINRSRHLVDIALSNHLEACISNRSPQLTMIVKHQTKLF